LYQDKKVTGVRGNATFSTHPLPPAKAGQALPRGDFS